MTTPHINVYINKLLSKLDQSKLECGDYMAGYRDALAFAITAIQEAKANPIASTQERSSYSSDNPAAAQAAEEPLATQELPEGFSPTKHL